MTRSKKIFAAIAFAFVLFLVYVIYDISTRTTFPGARKAEPDSRPHAPGDTVASDSTP
jgi:hypothetical protein